MINVDWLLACISLTALHRTYCITFSMSWKAKCHEANWNPIYDLLHVVLCVSCKLWPKDNHLYYEAKSFEDMWSEFDLQMSCKVKYIGANHHSQLCTYIVTCLLWAYPITSVHPLLYTMVMLITSPPEGVARYCFHPVCLSVCVCVCLSVYLCVRPIFWYFISRLLEEISIWNLYWILIGLYSIH